jgi:hypothetical protein
MNAIAAHASTSVGRFFRIVLLGLTLLLSAPWDAAPARAADPAPAIDAATRKRVVDAVAGYVEKHYVVADLAPTLAGAIRRNQKKGAYDSIATAEELKARLTADLQAVVPDRHLKVLYSTQARPLRDTPDEPSPEEQAERRQDAIRQNFYIERAEHLDGNVGYIKLRKFEDPALAGEALVAAMQFLSHTDALLVDLRQNGGGYGSMADLFASYFFGDEPVHLSDAYDRSTGETSQSWTLPYVPGLRYVGKPVYILTASRTFSAAEGFTYCLQKMGRAVVVGETTGGGAHFVHIFQIDPHFAVMVPVGTVKSAVTGSDWEGTGVVPDVAVAADTALPTAHRLALEKLLESTPDGPWADWLNTLIGEMRAEAQPAQDAAAATSGMIGYDACVGRYQAPMGFMDIRQDGDTLVALLDSGERIALEPRTDGAFDARPLGATFTFVRNAAGDVTHIHVVMNGQAFDAPRSN